MNRPFESTEIYPFGGLTAKFSGDIFFQHNLWIFLDINMDILNIYGYFWI